MRACVFPVVVGICLAGPVFAADPAAIIEDVSANAGGLQPMDYVAPGKVIALAANQTLTLGYMKSCVREVIAGGKVTIGAEQSVVDGGKVERSQVRCDGGRLKLTAEQASKSGGMVFRRPPNPNVPIDVTIYGVSPMLELKAGSKVTIERLDANAAQIMLAPSPQQLQHGKFLDLARENTALAPGGVYRAAADGKQIVFKVDPTASVGASPVVGRLLRF
jgi:hypothetical protein